MSCDRCPHRRCSGRLCWFLEEPLSVPLGLAGFIISPYSHSRSNRDSLHVFQGPSGSSLTSSLCRLLRQTQRHHPPLCCYHSSMKRGIATQNSHTLSLLISRYLFYMSSSHPHHMAPRTRDLSTVSEITGVPNSTQSSSLPRTLTTPLGFRPECMQQPSQWASPTSTFLA